MQDVRLSSRERVRLALAHRETDRTAIAMVCSGINEPTRSEFGEYIRSKGHGDLESYLDPLLDIKGVGPQYNGPRLEPGSASALQQASGSGLHTSLSSGLQGQAYRRLQQLLTLLPGARNRVRKSEMCKPDPATPCHSFRKKREETHANQHLCRAPTNNSGPLRG
jgi:hypothetical protein